MFGATNNSFGGFNTNNQQQQPSGGLFGAPPSTSSFGTFGQQPAPTPFSQPPQSTGFGNNAFGTPASSAPFGNTPAPTNNLFAQPQPQSSGLFGGSAQPQSSPNPGFGGFGATSSNNTFGSFGSNNNPTNTGSTLFGQKPAASTAPFGSGPATGFGANVFSQNTASPFGAAGLSAPPNGTANPPYAPVTLAENESTPSQKSTFNSIVAMDAYKNFSFEELRLQDYLQGRKTAVSANAPVPGFGVQQQPQQSAFGTFGTNNPQVGGFGQPQQQQQQPQTSFFGSAPATNTFGAQTTANRNIFGQPSTSNASPFNQNQAPATSTFGAAAAPSTNGFGSNNLFNSNTPNPSPFGTQAAKPNIFGGASTQPAFGAQPTSTAPTTGLFGSAPTQPQSNLFGAANNQNSSTGLFGNSNNSTNTQPSGGLFGTNTNQNNAQKPGGLFGANTNTGSSLFGQPAQPTNNTASFGFPQNNQQQPTSSLFGNNNQPPANATGGLFGANSNQQAQPGASGGLFGANNNTNLQPNAGTGLFGNNNQTNATSGGLFGQKTVNQIGSLFGNKDGVGQNNTNTFGTNPAGGLFGSSQTTANFGLGNNNNQNNNPGNNLFGSMNNSQLFSGQMNNQNGLFQSQQNQQPVLQARVDQDAYGNNPLFANRGISSGSKPAIPIKKQLPIIDFKPLPRPNTKITKLRGFARSVSPAKSAVSGSPLAASVVSNGSTVVSRSSAYTRAHEEPLLSPKAFIVKPSPKKLTIDPATLSTLFRNRSSTLNGSPSSVHDTPPPPARTHNVVKQSQSLFDPDAESSAQNVLAKVSQAPLRNVNQELDLNHSTKAPPVVKTSANLKDPPNPTSSHRLSLTEDTNSGALMEDEVVIRPRSQAKDGEYWTLPSIEELRMMKTKDLKSVPNFKAGRVGYGRIEFQEHVDLSRIENLETDLCGEVIVFKQSLCSVYPDDPVDKPPVGEELNVPAVITLDNCWALDKATRMPLKDPAHPRVKLFTKRLMKSEDTDFIEYDARNGQWTFAVQHFTTYGIDDSEEDSDEEEEELDEELYSQSYTDSEARDDLSVSDGDRVNRTKSQYHPSGSEAESLLEEDESDAPPRTTLLEADQEDDIPGRAPLLQVSRETRPRSDDETTASVTGSDELEVTEPPRPISKKRPRQGTDPVTDNDQSNQNPDWKNRSGLESRKVAVMQASLFARSGSVRSQSKLPPDVPPESQVAYPPNPRMISNISLEKSPQPHARRKSPNQQTSTLLTSFTPEVKKNSNALVRLRYPQSIPLSKSLAYGKELSTKTFNLAMARSFRVSWIGQSHQIISPARGEIGNMLDTTDLQQTTFGDLAVSTIPIHAFDTPTEVQSAERLLKVQLANTTIRLEKGIPMVTTNPNLRFRDFLASYDKTDRSNDAIVWGLGSALLDELNLCIPEGATSEVIERIKSIRREDTFSKWLERTVAPSVEQDVRSPSRQQGRFSSIFKLLTGNQIERACELAIQMGNYRLATLIAQCGRSDATFKVDMLQQNLIWRQLRIDAHLDRDLRKTYELISGNVLVSKGSGKKGLQVDFSEDITISEGLDWKRTLGLHFWFLASPDNFWGAIKTFEDAFKVERCAPVPISWYMDPFNSNNSELVINRWESNPDQPVYDAIFELIKMYVDPTHSLESVLEPRGFGPSPFDYRMPWHLYVLISRVLRLRDFEDREPIIRDIEIESDDGSIPESGSVVADLLTSQYADQLTKLGLLRWAGFVLLHLEHPENRVKALTELISRNISSVTEDVEAFYVETLKIPCAWIDLARAQLAHYQGRFYDEYKLFMKSSKIPEAHRIVTMELAPEAILRGDYRLIKKLFCDGLTHQLSTNLVGSAKIFLDFVKAMEVLQILNPSSTKSAHARSSRNLSNSRVGNESLSKEEIEDILLIKVPSLIKDIPGVFNESSKHQVLTVKQQVCVNEMMSSLMNLIQSNSRSRTTVYDQRNQEYRNPQDRSLLQFNPSYHVNNLVNLKDLKISDQVSFIQNLSHQNFLNSLEKFSDNRVPPTISV